MAGDNLSIGGRRFEILHGEGHAPEQVILYSAEDKLLLAADQVLAKITPNVSVWVVDPDGDPLRLYLRSLKALKAKIHVTPWSYQVTSCLFAGRFNSHCHVERGRPGGGFIKSLASPGSNVTGSTNQLKDVIAKHHQLLLEIRPGLERLGQIFTPSNAGSALGLQENIVAMREFGVTLIPISLDQPRDADGARAFLPPFTASVS
jgi:hypothetical protein